MPSLELADFYIVCAVLGGFITFSGLVSHLFKEKLYVADALLPFVAGFVFSPEITNIIRPLEYTGGSQPDLESVTLYFSRLVLGVQLIVTGVQLPSRFILREWRSLSILLFPGMMYMWLSTSFLVWALIGHISFLEGLAIGACVTPTDPVLSNSLVKGRFAEDTIPKDLRHIIVAESGSNDGLGYPFLYLALYIMKYTGPGAEGGLRMAMGQWFGEMLGYKIILSIVYGIVVGWVAKELLRWAQKKEFVDRESFLVFAVTLALFIIGTCGILGIDDVLACFVAGNAFTIDDWFREETSEDSFQPTIDKVLDLTIFLWFGALCPWKSFLNSEYISIWKLIALAILVLLFRRLPYVFAVHKAIPQFEKKSEALFVGFFGPIGVSAIFYLYVSTRFLREMTVDGVEREDAERLRKTMEVTIWFLVACSVIVHGLAIAVGKLAVHAPGRISNFFKHPVKATEDESRPFLHAERGREEEDV